MAEANLGRRNGRTTLPARRPCTTFDFQFRGIGYTASVGFKVDPETGVIGDAGELFLDCHKSSSDLTALARDAAVSISLALQHGAASRRWPGP